MTGYGRGECARDGFKITVELGAVNRRQSEISVNLPRELEMLEAQVRDAINAQVARGRVTARIGIHAADGQSSARAHINLPLAKAYATELARLAKSLKISGDSFAGPDFARAGSFSERRGTGGRGKCLAGGGEGVETGAGGARENARTRGRASGGGFDGAHRHHAAKRSKKSRNRRRKRRKITGSNLLERIKSAGIENIAPDDERLLKEIVLFADRSDISEELTRLQSHFKQFEDCRKSKEPVGRTLDFLAQEMNREINTIGSKANDAVISREVVTLKTELERFREQAQNVE